MGTISNSLASAPVSSSTSSSTSSSSSGSTSSSNPSDYFMGTSSYSQDFQAVIERAVTIASLPINILTDQQTTLTTQSNDLTNLDSQFSKLQAAVEGIGDALGGSNYQAAISQPNSVSASLGDGAVEGDYTINVTNVGSYATSLTTQSWNGDPDPSGNPSTYTLMVGGKGYTFTPADNSAASVAAAINSNYSGMVQALAVNVGTSDTPDWRISLQSTSLGPMSLDLHGPPPGLQAQQAAVNGYSTSQTAAAWNSTADPSGNPTTYNLTIGASSYAITSADNNIQTVVNAINNSEYGSQVKASIVNVAASGAPEDDRIQLTGMTTSAETLDLERMPSSLQQQQALNGDGDAVSETATTWNSAADASGNPNTYNLIIGSNTYTITPANNTAQGVAAAINQQYGGQVQAMVVDGPGGDSDPRIQLTSTTPGATNLDLQKTSALQDAQAPGALASYEVLNSGKTVTSDSRSVTVAQGVNLTLLANSNGPLDVTVTRSSSALDTALSAFATAYNATFDLVNAQHGQSAGSLQGTSILSQMSQALSSISTYSSSSGSVSVLDGLGLDLGSDGHLTYTEGTLLSTDFSNSPGVTAFLGSATGGGFLENATNALNNLETPTTGVLKAAEADDQTQLTTLASSISTKQSQLQQYQLNLENQMAQSDAMIASMQQQYSYLTSMFAAEQTDESMYK